MAIRILLADDHKIIREGLKSFLDEKTDMEVVAEARNGREAVLAASAEKPDVVIMDITMPDLNGIEASKQILKENQNIKVVALSMHSDKQFVKGMFQAGASAYLLKDCAPDELAEAIRLVYANHTYLSREISDVMVREFVNSLDKMNGENKELLTDREKEVLQLLAEGKTTRQMSEILFVSVKTVEAHRQKIMHKLDLHSVPELTKYAIRAGLTSLDS